MTRYHHLKTFEGYTQSFLSYSNLIFLFFHIPFIFYGWGWDSISTHSLKKEIQASLRILHFLHIHLLIHWYWFIFHYLLFPSLLQLIIFLIQSRNLKHAPIPNIQWLVLLEGWSPNTLQWHKGPLRIKHFLTLLSKYPFAPTHTQKFNYRKLFEGS